MTCENQTLTEKRGIITPVSWISLEEANTYVFLIALSDPQSLSLHLLEAIKDTLSQEYVCLETSSAPDTSNCVQYHQTQIVPSLPVLYTQWDPIVNLLVLSVHQEGGLLLLLEMTEVVAGLEHCTGNIMLS